MLLEIATDFVITGMFGWIIIYSHMNKNVGSPLLMKENLTLVTDKSNNKLKKYWKLINKVLELRFNRII